jgi:hypothetical protein
VFSVENPYRLTRDIVIKSASETPGQLDFQFLSGKVLIGSGVTVTLENLVVRNIRWAQQQQLQRAGSDQWRKLAIGCAVTALQQWHVSVCKRLNLATDAIAAAAAAAAAMLARQLGNQMVAAGSVLRMMYKHTVHPGPAGGTASQDVCNWP